MFFSLKSNNELELTLYIFGASINGSNFEDIFDVDHFITSLRDEVRILKQLPPRLKKRVEAGMFYTMPPISWSDISYYRNQVSSFHVLFLVSLGYTNLVN